MTILVVIEQDSTTAGAVNANRSTGKSHTVKFPSPDEESDARGANAQWVTERAPGITLANFGEIKFTDCAALEGVNYEISHGVSGGTTIDLVVDGNALATAAINGDSEVDVKYTGV